MCFFKPWKKLDFQNFVCTQVIEEDDKEEKRQEEEEEDEEEEETHNLEKRQARQAIKERNQEQ